MARAMNRARLSTRDRVALFEAHRGRCHICQRPIMAGEAWDRSHPIPLAAGGADEPHNWAPAHKKCHRLQTSTVDQPLIAKVKRVHARHIGARALSPNPVPGSRNTRWKKKMSGEVVRR